MPEIVRVEETDEGAPGRPNSDIAYLCCISSVVQQDWANAVVAEGTQVCARGVGGAVIDDQQLPVIVRLREDRFHRFPENAVAVVRGNDDGNQRPEVHVRTI